MSENTIPGPGEPAASSDTETAAPIAPTAPEAPQASADAPGLDAIDLDSEEEEPVALAPEGEPNYVITSQFTYDNVKDKPRSGEVGLFPSSTMEKTKEVLDSMPQVPLGDDAKSQEWISVLNGGLSATPFANGLTATSMRMGAKWTQSVKSPTSDLAGGIPRHKVKEGVKPTADQAGYQIRAALGMGTVFMIPLWHSGFWITVKSPSEGALLELYRRINSEKITLGRSTYGFMFSNGTSYTSRILLDFILEHMYESSLALKEDEDIRSFIRVPDLPLLIWGIACATWPNGFQYQRACIADPEKCKHVIRETLNLSKLLWTDSKSLTEHQIKHMTQRQRGSVDTVAVKRYVDEFILGQDRKIEITPNLHMVMRVPTAAEHIDAGYRWINTIEETYSRAMNQDERERDEFLLSQGKATGMRQYTHFVKAIVVGDNEFDEIAVIEDTLNTLTANDEIRNAFMEKAREFLDSSIVSMIAIPTYKCPACGKEQKSPKELPSHPNLIPLDVIQTFFQLLVQKMMRIKDR